jgi:alpha,alpha-trehalase
MTDCATFGDTKLNSKPILYFPAEEPIPAAMQDLSQRCHIEVRHLPHAIHREGELLQEEIPTPGLLYLPKKYVVPGGRFNEMYGWDSYFIILGLLADGRIDLARGMAENFFYEIEHYGAVLNANRTYYLTRSQPPFLSSMVLAVYDAMLTKQPAEARSFLSKALPYLLRDHELWVTDPHLDVSGLSEYADRGSGPVPEMADDSHYYDDVLHWLVDHGDTATPYLVLPNCPNGVCPPTYKGYALSLNFFESDRAMRESGFDVSFRFGPFSEGAASFAPLCLNSLLYKYEQDIATIEQTLANPAKAAKWKDTATDRKKLINKYMWDEQAGMFFDFRVSHGQRSQYKYLTAYYALWTGLATPHQASRLAANLKFFEHTGGLAMSTTQSGMQWDAPFGWAPTNWLTIDGLRRYGFNTDARRIAREFSATIENNFALDHTIREKYNVESADANVAVAAGYKANVIGFGWTNGVYLQMQRLLATPGPGRDILPAHHDPHLSPSAP